MPRLRNRITEQVVDVEDSAPFLAAIGDPANWSVVPVLEAAVLDPGAKTLPGQMPRSFDPNALPPAESLPTDAATAARLAIERMRPARMKPPRPVTPGTSRNEVIEEAEARLRAFNRAGGPKVGADNL